MPNCCIQMPRHFDDLVWPTPISKTIHCLHLCGATQPFISSHGHTQSDHSSATFASAHTNSCTKSELSIIITESEPKPAAFQFTLPDNPYLVEEQGLESRCTN